MITFICVSAAWVIITLIVALIVAVNLGYKWLCDWPWIVRLIPAFLLAGYLYWAVHIFIGIVKSGMGG